MCLLVVAWRVVPGMPLLIAANRDELLNRPATTMTVLREGPPRVLGGRDELSGGTWLAVNEHGVFAGLTNQPLGAARDFSRRTRGELPLALASHSNAQQAVVEFLDRYEPSNYNGSWLLVGDRDSLYFIDFTGLVDAEAVELPPGLHVLENRPLGAPSPKADRVVRSLGALTGDAEADLATLQHVLADHRVPESSGLEDSPKTSSNCVHLEAYGTRSSCIIGYGEEEAAHPQLWVADGAPCSTPFFNVSELWTSMGV